MQIDKENMISLTDLAKEVKVNNTKLAYYIRLKILKPFQLLGGINIFEKDKAIKTLEQVKDFKKEKYTLKEIVKKIN